MRYESKTKEDLIAGLRQLRKRIADLEKEKAKRIKAEKKLYKIRENLEIRIQKRTFEVTRANVELKEEVDNRKKAQKAIEELERQVEFVLGATKTGLDIIDSNYNIHFIDPHWAKVYGDHRNKKCYEYFMDRKEACPDCGIKKALATKTTIITEENLIKEGNRPIQVITIPFQSEEGQWMVAEVNIDITERKKVEGDLRNEIKELEKAIERLKLNNSA